MLLWIAKTFFPNYYKAVWNREFTNQMMHHQLELYKEFPGHEDLVDAEIAKSYERWLKK